MYFTGYNWPVRQRHKSVRGVVLVYVASKTSAHICYRRPRIIKSRSLFADLLQN